jgi:hypothetical protein
MLVELTTPYTKRFYTQGKIVKENIDVVAKLQEKTVSTSGTVTPDEGYAGLSKVEVIFNMPRAEEASF